MNDTPSNRQDATSAETVRRQAHQQATLHAQLLSRLLMPQAVLTPTDRATLGLLLLACFQDLQEHAAARIQLLSRLLIPHAAVDADDRAALGSLFGALLDDLVA